MINKGISRLKKIFDGERGAVTFIEASILIPLAFLLIFFLLFISLLFEQQNFQRNKIVEYSLIPTTDKEYLEYENIMRDKYIQVSENGFFLKTFNLQHENKISWGQVFQLFKINSSIELTQYEKLRSISKANNIWRYEAINAWIKTVSKELGGD